MIIMWLPFPLLTQSLVRGGHHFPLHQSARHHRCGRTNFAAAAWSIGSTRALLKASRDLGSKMKVESCRDSISAGRCSEVRCPDIRASR